VNTWRAFVVHVQNLSPNSAFVQRMDAHRDEPERITDHNEAEQYMKSWAAG